MRLLFLAALAALLSIPAPAEAGPIHRLRDRLHQRHAAPTAPVLPAPQPAVIPQMMPARLAAVGAAAGEHELHRGLLLDFARHHAVERAVRDGVKLPDGTVKKLTRAEAKEYVGKIGDDTLYAGVKAMGAPVEGAAVGDGGGKLQLLFQWLWDHREEIIAFILKLLPLFFAIDADNPDVILVAWWDGSDGWRLAALVGGLLIEVT